MGRDEQGALARPSSTPCTPAARPRPGGLCSPREGAGDEGERRRGADRSLKRAGTHPDPEYVRACGGNIHAGFLN